MGEEMGSRGGRGDFNDIVTQADKQGGNRRVDSSINLFRTFITEIKMGEVTFRGKRWTWANNRQGEGFIEKRLDMFFGSAEWLSDFDKSVVQHVLTSDHYMILLNIEPSNQN